MLLSRFSGTLASPYVIHPKVNKHTPQKKAIVCCAIIVLVSLRLSLKFDLYSCLLKAEVDFLSRLTTPDSSRVLTMVWMHVFEWMGVFIVVWEQASELWWRCEVVWLLQPKFPLNHNAPWYCSTLWSPLRIFSPGIPWMPLGGAVCGFVVGNLFGD